MSYARMVDKFCIGDYMARCVLWSAKRNSQPKRTNMTQDKLLWTVQEASASLCMNASTMRRYLRDGKIRGVKLNSLDWRIPTDEVKRIASEGICCISGIETKKNGSTSTIGEAVTNA